MTGVIRGRIFTRISFPPLYEVEFLECGFYDCVFDRLDRCMLINCKVTKVTFEVIYDSVIQECLLKDCSAIAFGGNSRITSNFIEGNSFSGGTAYPAGKILPPSMDWVHALLAMAFNVVERMNSDPAKTMVEDNYTHSIG